MAMAFSSSFPGLAFFLLLLLVSSTVNAQMKSHFYRRSCPKFNKIVRKGVSQALAKEQRLGASLLRLFFHDCFVNGCDGSLLLDDNSTFRGEKNAFPNRGTSRGFELIDKIKIDLEAKCPDIVSCSDILALATREGVRKLGGPWWSMNFGRRDTRTASERDANRDLPSPLASLSQLIKSFSKKGLSARDLTALSGAHTIGQAQCFTFRKHIYNDTDIDPDFAKDRQANCPWKGGSSNLAPLEEHSPNRFNNRYYKNLEEKHGLLHSDQELFNGGSVDSFVRIYSRSQFLFFKDFAIAMTKMSNISPLTGPDGEVRKDCRKVN